ncbi:MAG: hypothetical protein PHD82_16835, partial [Candidatus Riflebacteria bacterium]|nr:hypothetical protein [Candidatus Riflebacteria bacterium]
MRIKNFLLTGLFALLCGFVICGSASALPSLDAQLWDTLQVDEKMGNAVDETMITVIRDSNKPLVWYYVPNRPRLAETVTKIDGNKVTKPIFQLMTLQTKSAKTKNIYEEGLLQFALRMDLQPETASQAKNLIFQKNKAATDKNKAKIEALKGEITTLETEKTSASAERQAIITEEVKEKNKLIKELDALLKVETIDQISLLPLPISSASISIYQPSGEWLSGGIQAPAIAPIFSTQAVPFQLNLTSLGADAMKALTQKGQGGLGVYYEMHFEGVLPPAKMTVEVDWDQTYTHFSDNKKEKHYWNALLFAGGTSRTETASISNDLIENKCITVTMEGREDELEALQKVLDPILERINNELIEKLAPPEECKPAEAPEPDNGIGMFYGGGSSYSMKNKKDTKTGKEKITFERAKIVTRATSCGTFIGIGNYDKKIIEEANIVMEPGNWEKAYYTLPAVGNDPSLIQIDLNQYVIYKDGSGKPAGSMLMFSGAENPQLITWGHTRVDGKAGWVNKDGDPVSNITWPLQ